MKPYKPWSFCQSINCDALIRPEELRKQTVCCECTAYKMHQYLIDNGQILEEGSELKAKIDQFILAEKALELACSYIREYFPNLTYEPVRDHKARKASDQDG